MTGRDDQGVRGMGLLALAGLAGYVVVSLSVGIAFAVPVGVIGAIAVAIILRGPLGKAIAHRMEGVQGGAGEEVYAELDDLRNRVVELEERVDFTERLLTQAREGGRLAGELHDPGEA